jgi:poly-gamma-glutamate capsule biosynthesis protein CapA/YwtB (metallophosphatase superfamily)
MRTQKRSGGLLLLLPLLAGSLVLLACQSRTAGTGEVIAATGPQAESTPAKPANNEPVIIAAVGDIMLGSTFPNESRMPPNDGADELGAVTPILSAADIAFGNLEGPMLEGGVSSKCPPTSTRCFAFRVPTRYGKYLKDAGFDILNLANNHAGDFGDNGRASTRKVLDDLGLKHSGSDRSAQFATVTLDVKGKKVTFVSFAHNNIALNLNDVETARQVVTAAKKRSDLVVVSYHGGAEGTGAQHVPYNTEIFVGEARGNLRVFTHAVIDAGADLVLGHGPHVMRGMEIYKGHLIAYSLGNFATYGWFQLAAETALSEILEVKIGADGKFISGKIHPVKQEGRGGPQLDPSKAAIPLLRNLSNADFAGSAPKIADDGTITP